MSTQIPTTLLSDTSFLCGGAGTGKTYLAREMVKRLPGTVLAASTGIAAVNLGEGTTINALLKYFDTASLTENYQSGRLLSVLRKLYQRGGVRRIILDEVSMVPAEQLTIFARVLKELAGQGYDTTNDIEADEAIAIQQQEEGAGDAWPIQLMLVGDYAQLPPVKAPFAFESEEWPQFADHCHTLTEVRRQADAEFIAGLWAARRGEYSKVLEVFTPQLVDRSDPNYQGLSVFAKNEEVDRYNGLRLDKLPGPRVAYQAERWGQQRGDWKIIPDQLQLKVGAVVMILANKREEALDPDTPAPLIYANGDMGVIRELFGNCVTVELDRTGACVDVTFITRNNEIPLEPGRAKALTLEGKDHLINGRMEIVGTVTYMPLRVGYASTVHKCQGLSLDHVQINLRDGFFKTPGMLYVALSRARSLEGLRLVGTAEMLRGRCTVNPKIRPWL